MQVIEVEKLSNRARELCVAVFNPEMSLNSDNCGTAGGGEGRASFP